MGLATPHTPREGFLVHLGRTTCSGSRRDLPSKSPLWPGEPLFSPLQLSPAGNAKILRQKCFRTDYDVHFHRAGRRRQIKILHRYYTVKSGKEDAVILNYRHPSCHLCTRHPPRTAQNDFFITLRSFFLTSNKRLRKIFFTVTHNTILWDYKRCTS